MLQNLFNDYAVDLEFIDVENITELVDSLIKSNQNLTESLETNDLELIGKDINKLRTIINQLESARNKEKEREAELLEKEESLLNDLLEDEKIDNTITNTNFYKSKRRVNPQEENVYSENVIINKN